MEIEQTLLEIRELENQIHDAEIKRDNSIEFYRRRIAEAEKVFGTDAYDARIKLENLFPFVPFIIIIIIITITYPLLSR